MEAVATFQNTDVLRVHVVMTNDAGILRVELQPRRKGRVRLSSPCARLSVKELCMFCCTQLEREQGANRAWRLTTHRLGGGLFLGLGGVPG